MKNAPLKSIGPELKTFSSSQEALTRSQQYRFCFDDTVRSKYFIPYDAFVSQKCRSYCLFNKRLTTLHESQMWLKRKTTICLSNVKWKERGFFEYTNAVWWTCIESGVSLNICSVSGLLKQTKTRSNAVPHAENGQYLMYHCLVINNCFK